MGKKLNTSVHVTDTEGNSGTFGPDDDLPAWAEKAISNPDVWAEEEKKAPAKKAAAKPSDE